jgi:hypothetical protein
MGRLFTFSAQKEENHMALKELRPSVMRSSEWWKREQRDEGLWQQLRDQMKRRDNWTCVYCGFRSYTFMMVNHIGAEDHHSPQNLETNCKPCHAVLHIGMNALQGYLSVIDSTAQQVEIVRYTRKLVHLQTPWPPIEQQVLAQLLAPSGKVYSQEESVAWANRIIHVMPPNAFRSYLPDGFAVIFHEQGPWQNFPEAVHMWG